MLSPTEERLRQRRAKAFARDLAMAKRVALYGAPVLVVALGLVYWRYAYVQGLMDDVERVVRRARAYNTETDRILKEAMGSRDVAHSEQYLSRMTRSARIAQALALATDSAGFAPVPDDPVPLPAIDLGVLGEGAGDEGARVVLDGITLTCLIDRQCTVIEDRLRMCREYVADSMLRGELVMMSGAQEMVDAFDMVMAEEP